MCYHRGRRTMLRVLEKNTAWAASSAPHARFRAAACHLAPHAYHWCGERRRSPVLWSWAQEAQQYHRVSNFRPIVGGYQLTISSTCAETVCTDLR